MNVTFITEFPLNFIISIFFGISFISKLLIKLSERFKVTKYYKCFKFLTSV